MTLSLILWLWITVLIIPVTKCPAVSRLPVCSVSAYCYGPHASHLHWHRTEPGLSVPRGPWSLNTAEDDEMLFRSLAVALGWGNVSLLMRLHSEHLCWGGWCSPGWLSVLPPATQADRPRQRFEGWGCWEERMSYLILEPITSVLHITTAITPLELEVTWQSLKFNLTISTRPYAYARRAARLDLFISGPGGLMKS